MKTTLYRVEHKKSQEGPYHDSSYRSMLFAMRCYGSRHPGPQQLGFYPEPDDRFGFESLTDLLEWFCHSVREDLHQNDFHIVEIEAEMVWTSRSHTRYKGLHQCAFNSDSAVQTNTLDIF
jgi:hypothetical protein